MYGYSIWFIINKCMLIITTLYFLIYRYGKSNFYLFGLTLKKTNSTDIRVIFCTNNEFILFWYVNSITIGWNPLKPSTACTQTLGINFSKETGKALQRNIASHKFSPAKFFLIWLYYTTSHCRAEPTKKICKKNSTGRAQQNYKYAVPTW